MYNEVKEKLIPAVEALKRGDPKDEDVFIGPLISEKEAQRVESWVRNACAKGTALSFSIPSQRHLHCPVATPWHIDIYVNTKNQNPRASSAF